MRVRRDPLLAESRRQAGEIRSPVHAVQSVSLGKYVLPCRTKDTMWYDDAKTSNVVQPCVCIGHDTDVGRRVREHEERTSSYIDIRVRRDSSRLSRVVLLVIYSVWSDDLLQVLL